MVRVAALADNGRMPYATDIPAAPAADLVRHYRARLAAETDCSDVHATLRDHPDRIVVVDTRSPEAFAAGHVPGAVNIPPERMTADGLAAHGDVLFVTCCWGPHCNGATKGAARVAELGFPVKEMLGGVWGWEMEGFALARLAAEVPA